MCDSIRSNNERIKKEEKTKRDSIRSNNERIKKERKRNVLC